MPTTMVSPAAWLLGRGCDLPALIVLPHPPTHPPTHHIPSPEIATQTVHRAQLFPGFRGLQKEMMVCGLLAHRACGAAGWCTQTTADHSSTACSPLPPSLPSPLHPPQGVRSWLNRTCDLPLDQVVGFRSPWLIHNPGTRRTLHDAGGWRARLRKQQLQAPT